MSTPPTTFRVVDAMDIAYEAHKHQTRRDGITPYTKHLQDVVLRLEGETPDYLMTAWLHDVLEDTAETVDSLFAKGVPDAVLASVIRLTKIQAQSYLGYLQLVKEDPVARKVKIADMLSNLSDNPTQKQILKYAKGLVYLLED